MSPGAFTEFSICLECLSPGNAPAWSPAVARHYSKLLEPIPDEHADALYRAVGLTASQFRPSPPEIIETWRKLTGGTPAMTAIEAVAEIYRAITEPQYFEITSTREVFVADPGQIENIEATKAHFLKLLRANQPLSPCPGHEIKGHWETRQETAQCRTFPEPGWVKAHPVLSKIVAAMGGWNAIATGGNIEAPSMFRGQLRRVAEAVIEGQGETTIRALRLEYQADEAQRLTVAPMIEEEAA